MILSLGRNSQGACLFRYDSQLAEGALGSYIFVLVVLQIEEKEHTSQQPVTKALKKSKPDSTKAPKREWQRVTVEESLDTKVKRVRQVMQVSFALAWLPYKVDWAIG